MRQIKLVIEYDGSAYQGWQSQKSRKTIQDILCGATAGITGDEVKLTGASRTDAGVHALGQVAAFSTPSALPADILKRALNAKLPPDIRIIAAEEISLFHPRYDAIRKRYFYLIRMDRNESAFFHKYAWHVRAPLDLHAMRNAAALLSGEHDFSSFRGSGCSAKTPVRTVHTVQISAFDTMEFMTASTKGSFVKITVEANAFLRHMVRNIVGTLVEVGKGRMTVDGVRDILASKDRTKAGPTAPSHGLFLEAVFY
jgi:tRNA pseudouridine38-40 synthase